MKRGLEQINVSRNIFQSLLGDCSVLLLCSRWWLREIALILYISDTNYLGWWYTGSFLRLCLGFSSKNTLVDWSLLLVLFLVISSILLAVTNSGRLLLISLFNPFYQELNIFFRIDFISSPLLNFLRATTTLAYRTCCVRNNPDMQGSIHLYAEQYSVLWFLAPWIGIVELLEGFALRVLEIFCLAGDRRGIGEFRNSLGIWLLYWSQGLNFSSSLWKCTLLPFI